MPSFLTRNRRYAILLIAILAAVVTPTPDVFNMALMGGPLYLLFEIGVISGQNHRDEKGQSEKRLSPELEYGHEKDHLSYGLLSLHPRWVDLSWIRRGIPKKSFGLKAKITFLIILNVAGVLFLSSYLDFHLAKKGSDRPLSGPESLYRQADRRRHPGSGNHE